MEREKRIREMAERVAHGHIKIEDALNDVWDDGFKVASDKAYSFIKNRTPENEREGLVVDYIKVMLSRKERKE